MIRAARFCRLCQGQVVVKIFSWRAGSGQWSKLSPTGPTGLENYSTKIDFRTPAHRLYITAPVVGVLDPLAEMWEFGLYHWFILVGF